MHLRAWLETETLSMQLYSENEVWQCAGSSLLLLTISVDFPLKKYQREAIRMNVLGYKVRPTAINYPEGNEGAN